MLFSVKHNFKNRKHKYTYKINICLRFINFECNGEVN